MKFVFQHQTEQFEAFEESLTERQRKAWLHYQICRHQVEQFREGMVDVPGMSPERIQGIAAVLSTETWKERTQVSKNFGDEKSELAF